MSTTLNLLFSQPPAGVTDEEFNTWYDAHVPEILSIPGFVAARRYRMQPAPADGDGPVPFTYLAVYEIETDFATAMRAMEEASLGSYEQYRARKEADPSGPPIPDWFPQIEFHWWVGEPLGERVTAEGS